jgi:hypothetical protein
LPASAPADPGRARGLSFRAGIVSFGAMVGGVVAATAGLLVILDPRAQAFWAGRLNDAAVLLRGLVGR